MPNEFQCKHTTGATLNTVLIVAPTTPIAMTEGTGGIYQADFPTSKVAGIYPYAVQEQSGGAWNVDDEVVAQGVVRWDGTKEIQLATQSNNSNGVNTVTFTITDGMSALEGVDISVTQGVIRESDITDVNGQATFNLNSATYTIALYKAGYTYDGSTLVVSADATPELTMEINTITLPSDPSQSIASITTRDGQGSIKGSVTLNFQMTKTPSDSGSSFDGVIFTGTSNSSGLLTINLLQQATYDIWRGAETNPKTTFTVPAETTCQIPDFIGADAD